MSAGLPREVTAILARLDRLERLAIEPRHRDDCAHLSESAPPRACTCDLEERTVAQLDLLVELRREVEART